jgi:protein involved in polysaccharide export with SLBB domain
MKTRSQLFQAIIFGMVAGVSVLLSAGAPAQNSSTSINLSPAMASAATSNLASPSSRAGDIAPVAASANVQPAPLIGATGSLQIPPTLLQDQKSATRPQPYGSSLFSTSNVPTSLNILDPGYVLKPGDTIALWVGGGLPDQSQTVSVDPSGNMLVPGVGPVHVAGLTAAAVNGVVNSAASKVYSQAVKVYASPATTIPINVFVTGPVKNPGPYSGASTDSVVAFLQRAGGIDPIQGSYRNIVVRHGGQVVAQIDLYEFLRTGVLKPIRLHQDDVIVVGQQGPVVSVYGNARAAYSFELAHPSGGVGEEILYYARPRPQTNYAGLLGVRDTKPYNIYLPLAEFAKQPLEDGDLVSFNSDQLSDTISIQIVGAFHGPSTYVVPRRMTLAEVLAKIPLDDMADRRWIHLQRVSIALTQKQLLNESLSRLEKAIYTQSSSSVSVAQADAAQAQTLQIYINSASQVQPAGELALPPGADLSRVNLEADDTIVIPYRSQVVSIGGEVNQAQSLIYEPGISLHEYILKAGGFTNLADHGHILVIHPDSTSEVNGRVQPGDRILVLPHLPGKWLALAKDLTQILYQTAIAVLAATRA